MSLNSKFVKKSLEALSPIVRAMTLDNVRRAQDKIGEIMSNGRSGNVNKTTIRANNYNGIFVTPKDEVREGVMLYLHGGGYCCGDIEYAGGVAAMLADKCGMSVYAPAYRLAPENKFPAALEDAVDAYKYLLSLTHSGNKIVVCGESAGGGLVFALCKKLIDAGEELPAGIISISPWSDLTASGKSYIENAERDFSINIERLDFFASMYTENREDPMTSPLFADLSGMPKTLIFVGEREIMLDDAVMLTEKLKTCGVDTELVIAPDMWHAYVLYDLKERACDFDKINKFLSKLLKNKKLLWVRLDNAAKIYPAARNRGWSNVFRVSANVIDDVDVEILRASLDVTVRRFPTMAVRLCTGVFWYYLEELSEPPEISVEKPYPNTYMGRSETHKCAFRVLVYKKRIAIEMFHSITDGNGAMVFLKTLLAEYISRRYSVVIPATNGVLDRLEEPSEDEFEDSFLKYSGAVSMSRRESDAYRIRGTKLDDDFINYISFLCSVEEIHRIAKKYGVSITGFLTAAIMRALSDIQNEHVRRDRKKRPIKVLLPVNLRKIFKSTTLRNFVLYITPEINPGMGEYTFEEICKTVHYYMGMELNARRMGARISTNVNSEKMPIVKIMPLFIKNFVMKVVFNAVGERKCCLTMSNLGAVDIPEEMRPYITRFDFILGVPSHTPYNCGVISYGDDLRISFVRNIEERELEAHLYRTLRELGVHVKVESNQR